MGTNSTRAPERATTLSTKEAWDAAFATWEAAKAAYDEAAKLHDDDFAAAEAQGRPFDPDLAKQADGIAKALHPMTPERWLLLAMLHTMPADQFEKLIAFGTQGHPAIRGLMQLAKGGVGLNLEVMNALERLGQ